LRVEGIDCLQETERGHLHEVVEGLVRALIAASQLAREGKEAFDQLLAGPLVAVAQQALEKLVLGLTPDLRSRAFGFRLLALGHRLQSSTRAPAGDRA